MKMNGFTNYEDMFAQSIGLSEPWYIERVEFNERSCEVHIMQEAWDTCCGSSVGKKRKQIYASV